LQGSTTSVKRSFIKNWNDGLSSHHAPEVSQKHGTNVSQEQFSSCSVEQLKCWYSFRLRGKGGNKGKLSDVSKVGDRNVEMENQNNEVSNQANISSVEMTLKRKDKSLSNCPRPTELFSKVEKQYASYISKFPDAKIPFMLPSQKLDLYCKNWLCPILNIFDDRLKIYHQSNINSQIHGEGKQHCFSPASNF